MYTDYASHFVTHGDLPKISAADACLWAKVTGGRTVLFKSMQDQDPPRLSVVEDVMFIVVNAKFDQSVSPVNKRVPHR